MLHTKKSKVCESFYRDADDIRTPFGKIRDKKIFTGRISSP